MTELYQIFWDKKWNKQKKDLLFNIVVENCYVKSVTNDIVKWTIGESWAKTASWLEKRYCKITRNLEVNLK